MITIFTPSYNRKKELEKLYKSLLKQDIKDFEWLIYDDGSSDNTKEIVDLLTPYNIKLILQGHQHIYEQIQERGLWFVTAGGVSANWWTGPLADTEEGFLLIKVDNTNNFSWEYIDYGWDVH